MNSKVYLGILLVCFCILFYVLYPWSPLSPYIKDDPVNAQYHWNKSVVTVGISGEAVTQADRDSVNFTINDWNTNVGYPKMMVTRGTPDISLQVISRNTANKKAIDYDKYAGLTFDYANEDTLNYSEVYIMWHSRTCIEHELLHAMGLMYHSNHIYSVLYPSVDMWPICGMSYEDIAQAKEIYKCY